MVSKCASFVRKLAFLFEVAFFRPIILNTEHTKNNSPTHKKYLNTRRLLVETFLRKEIHREVIFFDQHQHVC